MFPRESARGMVADSGSAPNAHAADTEALVNNRDAGHQQAAAAERTPVDRNTDQGHGVFVFRCADGAIIEDDGFLPIVEQIRGPVVGCSADFAGANQR